MPFFNYSLLFEINFPIFSDNLGRLGISFKVSQKQKNKQVKTKNFFELSQMEKFLELKEKKLYFIVYRR